MCDFDLEPCDLWRMSEVKKCRKLHRCDCCHGPINAGSHYWILFSACDGEASKEKECDQCHEMAEAFSDHDGHCRSVPSYMVELISNCIWEDRSDPKVQQYKLWLNQVEMRGVTWEEREAR